VWPGRRQGSNLGWTAVPVDGVVIEQVLVNCAKLHRALASRPGSRLGLPLGKAIVTPHGGDAPAPAVEDDGARGPA
jgi:hypothetical protein